jgi:hypothetical protein
MGLCEGTSFNLVICGTLIVYFGGADSPSAADLDLSKRARVTRQVISLRMRRAPPLRGVQILCYL